MNLMKELILSILEALWEVVDAFPLPPTGAIVDMLDDWDLEGPGNCPDEPRDWLYEDLVSAAAADPGETYLDYGRPGAGDIDYRQEEPDFGEATSYWDLYPDGEDCE